MTCTINCCYILLCTVVLAYASVRLEEMSYERNKTLSIHKRAAEETPNRLLPEERIQFLKEHNMFRATTKPMAANMQKIFWSKELEIGAQMLTNRCVWKHNEVDEAKKRYKTYGQNLYGGGRNVEAAVKLWASEKKNYNYNTNTCNSRKVCAHYTQVVWEDSFLVGCGITYCKNLGYTMIACNYWNPGNYPRKPYIEGTPCSKCPETANKCVDNMCTMSKLDCSVVEPDCPSVDQENCLCDDKSYRVPEGNTPNLRTVSSSLHGNSPNLRTVSSSLHGALLFITLFLFK